MSLAILFLSFIAVLPSTPAPIDKATLIELFKSGVPETRIVETIKQEGVDFEPTPEVLQELRQIGFPRSIINSMVNSAGSKKPGQAVNSSQILLQQANNFYRQGQAERSIELLRSRLRDEPEDLRAREMLMLQLISQKRSIDAAAALQELRKMPQTEASTALVARIEPLLSEFEIDPSVAEKFKHELRGDLDRGRVDDATALIDQTLKAKPRTREILKFYLDSYQAKWANASTRIMVLNKGDDNDRQTAALLQDELSRSVDENLQVMKGINRYLYNALSTGACNPKQARDLVVKQEFSLQEYVRLVSNAYEHYPLNPPIMDLAFHALLLTAPYEEVKKLGDGILARKGSLRIPFFSRRKLFNLVIDRAHERIYTEDNKTIPVNEAGTAEMEGFLGIDLSFQRIVALSQKIGTERLLQSMSKDSFALKFEPGGVVPYYTFMPLIHCLYGESAQRSIARNLADYILHVVNRPEIKTDLVDPTKLSKDWLSVTSQVTALGTIAAVQVASSVGTNSSISTASFEGQMAVDSAYNLLRNDSQRLLQMNQLLGSRDDRISMYESLQAKAAKILESGAASERMKKVSELLDTLVK